MAETVLQLDVVVDVVCPWCYVGKRRLEHAMAMTPGIGYELRYRPFQLDASIPRAGVPRKAYIEAKLGGPERVRQAHRHLTEIGATLGIPFDFEAITRAPNTLDAHRTLRWAGEAGVQGDLVEILFRRYFVEGADIGDRDVLAEAAGAAGMNAAEVRSWLDTTADEEEVTAEVAHAQRIGVTGVPCLVIEARYAVTGAQEAPVLVGAFRDLAEEKRFGAKA